MMMVSYDISGGILIIRTLVWLLCTQSFMMIHAIQSDIDCLRAVKASLHDPSNYLASWNFENGTRTSICDFTGIECWHDYDNNVLNIKLAGMELGGEFPLGVVDCQAMTGLDLSNNKLTGLIPNNISHLIPYVTSLDLSSNQFSGQIPESLANCSNLNSLKLDNNQLTGHIPPQFGQLLRIRTFSVSNNRLSGPVPQFVNSTSGSAIIDAFVGAFVQIDADSYANNTGLCGGPSIPRCRGPPNPVRTWAIVGAAVGSPLGFAIGFWCTLYMKNEKKNKQQRRQQKEVPDLGNKWAKSIKGAKRIKVSIFEKKSFPKLSLNDVMKATNDFSNTNIIGTGITGTTYKAVLQDGTSLMVQRLQDTRRYSETEFISGMSTLVNCKHRNLVPLLGFCSTKKERFLIYTHMANGSLHDRLHITSEGEEIMDWPLRLKIAMGAARGLAWIHRTSVIHWNISSKYVLLDAQYEPKIFVPARLMIDPASDHTRLGRVIVTNCELDDNSGYVAPEFTRTPDGDVYSFGVMLLELVTREKPTYGDTRDIVEWISQLSNAYNLGEAIDGFLVGKGFDREIFRVLEVACNCVLSGRPERPTMLQVYRLLRDIGRRYDLETEDEVPVDIC